MGHGAWGMEHGAEDREQKVDTFFPGKMNTYNVKCFDKL
jgi:hypothetical protein